MPHTSILIYWSSLHTHKYSLLRLSQNLESITLYQFTPSFKSDFFRYLYFSYKLFLPNPNIYSLFNLLFHDIPLGNTFFLACEWSPTYKLLESFLLKFGANIYGLPHSLFFPSNNYLYAQHHNPVLKVVFIILFVDRVLQIYQFYSPSYFYDDSKTSCYFSFFHVSVVLMVIFVYFSVEHLLIYLYLATHLIPFSIIATLL